MRQRLHLVFLILVACMAVYAVLSIPSSRDSGLISPAYAQAQFSARQAVYQGSTVGEVLANGDVLFRIRTSAGGESPYQRAQVVAERLNGMMGDSLQPEDITTGRVGGQEVVLARNQVIVTADAEHARLNRTTPAALANLWATRIENVVAGRAVAETPVSQKIVPIISVGSGMRIGGAVVTGASDRLDQVRAVAQLEGKFGNAVRVRVLVPVSTENVVQSISRVPETSVTGLVDIKL